MGKKDPYRDSLNLPKTKFGMKANLLQMEPNFQKRWERIKLFERMRAKEHPKGPFIFHDGPPYANGPIHIGHLVNKCLKDMVVRSRTMAGYDVDYIPGWDCHGLPIEHMVMKKLGDKAKDMVSLQIRQRCQTYAEKYVKLQAKQMQRLGTMANYAEPYLTMQPQVEEGVLEVFADLVEQGIVTRALKPVHWSIANQTALAEAELEYYDRDDASVFVRFVLANAKQLPAALNAPNAEIAVMIWTTTPWTLPQTWRWQSRPKVTMGFMLTRRTASRSMPS